MENDLRELWYKGEFTVKDMLKEISDRSRTKEDKLEATKILHAWIQSQLSRETSCMFALLNLLKQWKN